MATLQHTSFQSFIKRQAVLTYYILTFAISWGVILIAVGPGGIPGSSEQNARVLSRLLTWRVGVRWYMVALLTAPLVWMAVLLAPSLISPVFLPGIVTTSDKAYPLLMGIVGGLIVGFFEELGWTGFATPRLRLRYGILPTGLIMGVLWAAFYILSYDLWRGATSTGALPVPLFLTVYGFSFLVGQMPAFRVLMVWVYDRTGSLLVARLMHASMLACWIIGTTAATGVAFLVYSFAVAVVLWVVVAAVVVANGGHLSRGEDTRVSPVAHNL